MNHAEVRDWAHLQSGLGGSVLFPHQPGYDEARKIWNGRIDRHPAAIVHCHSTEDVTRAVRFARAHAMPFAVRSGGHSIPGYSSIEGGMVIHLGQMKEVMINPDLCTASVQPGLTLGEFITSTQPFGLATTTGTVSGTGMAGLTLGGGLGWLMSKYGLTCDNVLSFELVTAEGEVVQASPKENSDLYWGLRGGGGNFGIVTRFKYQLYPLKGVLGGLLIHSRSRAREVLRFYRDFVADSPDELTVYSVLMTTPEGHPAIAVVPCYFGEDLEEGERILEPLRRFGSPWVDLIRPMSYLEMVRLIDETSPDGRNYYEKGCVLPELSDGAIDRLVESADRMTSPFSMILIQHVHGEAARIPSEDTAFAARGTSFMPVFMAGWDEGPAEWHMEWARSSYAAIKPFSIEAAYVNFLSADDPGRVRPAYGHNYERLLALKRRYDPENIFRMNANIQP